MKNLFLQKKTPQMEVRIKNILFAIGLFFISFLSCMIPKIVNQNKIINKAYYLLNMFVGGIQLSTLIVDFISHFAYNIGSKGHDHDHGHEHSHGNDDMNLFIGMGYIFIFLFSIDAIFLHNNQKNEESENHDHNSHDHNSHEHHSHEHHSHGHQCSGIHSCNSEVVRNSKTPLQSVILLLIVSFHSLFEGLPVSEDESKFNKLYCIGLGMHKILESFALGVSIFASNITLKTATILMLVYSIITPVGVIWSVILAEKVKSIKAWIEALSLGSLMYIVFIELIAHGFKDGKNVKKKLIMLFSGYSLGSLIIKQTHGSH